VRRSVEATLDIPAASYALGAKGVPDEPRIYDAPPSTVIRTGTLPDEDQPGQ
jgi:hypothetical protein